MNSTDAFLLTDLHTLDFLRTLSLCHFFAQEHMKTISVLVKIQIDKNLDAHEAIQDADYSFSLNGKELQTEIAEVYDEAEARVF